MKLLFIDLETTGVDVRKHGVIQIAGIIEIDGVEKERFDLKVAPFPQDGIDLESLKVHGMSEEEIKDFDNPREFYPHLMAIFGKYVNKFNKLDKFHLIGSNSRFDSDFLREWMIKNGDKYYGSWFFFPPIDVCQLAAVWFMGQRETFFNFKLGTVAKRLGIEMDSSKLHDALYDIEVTKQMYDTLYVARHQGDSLSEVLK